MNFRDRNTGLELVPEVPEEITLTDEYIDTVSNSRYFNDIYSDYYMRLYEETGDDKFKQLSERMAHCHDYWYGDHYVIQSVFDVRSILLCHDKFCVNCQHLKQASRLKRFTPIFEELQKVYDLYHLTLTVPNVPGNILGTTVDKMFNGFRNLIRYLKGGSKVKNVDFAQYGYVGAIRCLEIVVNPFDYHPHIHSLLFVEKDLPLYKTTINCYSYDHGVFKRKFSDLEILIQKIWYLSLNGEKVNIGNISAVPDGYSCTMDKIEGDEWHEAFKYVTKLTKNGAPSISYEQFKTLYDVLYKRRVMQGYGVLFRIAEDDSIDEEVAKVYEQIVQLLQSVEDPIIGKNYRLDSLMADIHNRKIKAITKRSIQKLLNENALTDFLL